MLSQLALAWGLAPSYLHLNQWDSDNYKRIAVHGYHIPPGKIQPKQIWDGVANAVFFPGYPLISQAVSRVTGVSIDLALLLSSQLACLLFWIYFFSWMEQEGIPPRQALQWGLLVFIYPSAYFMVTGYTESLFLAMMMGFLFWTDRWSRKKSPLSWFLALAHGGFLNFTRIVGTALAPHPIFEKARDWKAWVLGGGITAGCMGFFAFCKWKFNEWNLYFRLEEIGWGNHRLWLATLNPLTYLPHFFFEETTQSFNRLTVTFCGVAFLIMATRLWRLGKRGAPLWGLSLIAFLLFYIPVTGKAAAHLDSMARYTLPVLVLLTLCWARAERLGIPFLVFEGKKKKRLAWTLGLFSMAVQVWFAYRFARGHWIA